jgi:hypothetical protein
MAVELANSIQLDLPLSIPVVKLLQGPSVVELAAWLYEEIEKAAESVNRLSDEEVDSILAES